MACKRTLTAAQKQAADARRERFRGIVKQVAALSQEERAALAARMMCVNTEGRTLSMHNTALLAFQMPDATIVGGFNQWKAAGRFVRKGERGLMIWAPTRVKVAAAPAGDDAPGIGELDGINFIMITVFDISQTDAAGAPAPVDAPAEELVEA